MINKYLPVGWNSKHLCHTKHSTFNYIIDGEKLKQPRKICEKSYLSCESPMLVSKKPFNLIMNET